MKILRSLALLAALALCFASLAPRVEADTFCSYHGAIMSITYYSDASKTVVVGGCQRDCPGDGTMTWTCWGQQTNSKTTVTGTCYICTQ